MLLPLCAGTIVARLIGARVLAVYDDAYITFRYARNLAEGHGLVYHPGEWVMGTTTPAFALLQSGLHVLGLPLPAGIIALNIACDVAILVLLVGLLTRAGRPLAAVLFGALYAVSPLLTRVCVGGMEADLFCLLVLVAIGLWAAGRRIGAVVLASLLYFVRPEALLLVASFGLLELWSAGLRSALRLAAVSLASVLAPLALLWAGYGQVIAQSVFAKAQGVDRPLIEVARAIFAPDPLALAALPLALWGAWSGRRLPWLQPLALWAALYALAYLLARPLVFTWYVAPLQLASLALAAFGAEDLLRRVPALAPGLSAAGARRSLLAGAGGAIAVAVWAAVLLVGGPSPVTRNVTRPLAAFAADRLDGSTTILAMDIGMVGYFSDARIYDSIGLVWPEARSFDHWTEIALAYEPDYIFLTAIRHSVRQLNESGLSERYVPVIRFSRFGHDDLSLEPARYRDGRSQDYVMLRRRGPSG